MSRYYLRSTKQYFPNSRYNEQRLQKSKFWFITYDINYDNSAILLLTQN